MLVRDETVVYCHEHGCIHDATTDPYTTGQQDCHVGEHRTVYWRARVKDEESKEVA